MTGWVKLDMTEQWCRGDKPLVKGDDENVHGMIDNAVKKAQRKSRSSFIYEARVYLDSDDCAIIEGKPAKG
ncbi:MAG: hypothetical protein AB8G05_20735 [Oligoflexales bacterium]